MSPDRLAGRDQLKSPGNAFTALEKLHSHLKGLHDYRIKLMHESYDYFRVDGLGEDSYIVLGHPGNEMDFYYSEPYKDPEGKPGHKRLEHYNINRDGNLIKGGSVILTDFTSRPVSTKIGDALDGANRILIEVGIPLPQ